MGIFSRLSDIVNSNINAILDRAEDPEKIIRLIVQEMEDTLVEVRSAAVRTIAERKELERRVEALRREQEEWLVPARREIGEARRDQLLAGAALADHQHRTVERRQLGDLRQHRAERRRLADQRRKLGIGGSGSSHS